MNAGEIERRKCYHDYPYLSRIKYDYRIISGWQGEVPGSIIAPVGLASWPG
jgi:hypothetical protein